MDSTLLLAADHLDVAIQTVLLLAVPFDRDVLGPYPILPDVSSSISAPLWVAVVIVVGVAELVLEDLPDVEDFLEFEDDGW